MRRSRLCLLGPQRTRTTNLNPLPGVQARLAAGWNSVLSTLSQHSPGEKARAILAAKIESGWHMYWITQTSQDCK